MWGVRREVLLVIAKTKELVPPSLHWFGSWKTKSKMTLGAEFVVFVDNQFNLQLGWWTATRDQFCVQLCQLPLSSLLHVPTPANKNK